MGRLVGTIAIALVFLTAGCGGGKDAVPDVGAGAGGASGGCLSADQVKKEVNRIAEGFEASSTEVEAKQEEIRALQSEAC